MNEIKINLPEVANSASQIRHYNQTMDETLNYVHKLMNELNSVWQSDGQETLLNRFQVFSKEFIKEYETIESYAKFLEDAVSNYDSLETTIVSNASNFE